MYRLAKLTNIAADHYKAENFKLHDRNKESQTVYIYFIDYGYIKCFVKFGDWDIHNFELLFILETGKFSCSTYFSS